MYLKYTENMSTNFWSQIGAWLFNNVYRLYEQDTVIKVPKITSLIINQTVNNIQYALKAHQDILDSYLPQTQIIATWESPLWYIFKQKYIHWRRLTISDCQNDPSIAHDFVDLLARWEYMEKKHNLYFDLYGMEEYAKNIRRLLTNKDIVFGNILIDSTNKLHYIDVWYIRTDQIGFANYTLTQLMHNLAAIK